MPEIYVGLGSNQHRLPSLRLGVRELRRRFGPLAWSSLYESPDDIGGGAAYLNLVVRFASDAQPPALKQELVEIEDLAGRERRRRDVCALDLDLLLVGTLCRDEPPRLPHPQLAVAPYLLAGAAELAPALVHPLAGRPLAQLWRGHADATRVHLFGPADWLDPPPDAAQ